AARRLHGTRRGGVARRPAVSPPLERPHLAGGARAPPAPEDHHRSAETAPGRGAARRALSLLRHGRVGRRRRLLLARLPAAAPGEPGGLPRPHAAARAERPRDAGRGVAAQTVPGRANGGRGAWRLGVRAAGVVRVPAALVSRPRRPAAAGRVPRDRRPAAVADRPVPE